MPNIERIKAKQAEILQYDFDRDTLQIMERAARAKLNGLKGAARAEASDTHYALAGILNMLDAGSI